MTFTNRIADADQLREEISRHRPLKGQALKQLRDYFRIGLTWASNAPGREQPDRPSAGAAQ